jgi:hypothetical protein
VEDHCFFFLNFTSDLTCSIVGLTNIHFSVVGLTHEQNVRKMRLLTFVQLAETKKDLDFAVIQKEMQLESDELEDFIIDGKDVGLYH